MRLKTYSTDKCTNTYWQKHTQTGLYRVVQ